MDFYTLTLHLGRERSIDKTKLRRLSMPQLSVHARNVFEQTFSFLSLNKFWCYDLPEAKNAIEE